jgi:hypothetical protein
VLPDLFAYIGDGGTGVVIGIGIGNDLFIDTCAKEYNKKSGYHEHRKKRQYEEHVDYGSSASSEIQAIPPLHQFAVSKLCASA